MNFFVRLIIGILGAVGGYFLYIYVPELILGYIDAINDPQGGIQIFNFITIEITDYAQLLFYLQSVGYIIIGVAFAYNLAESKSKIKPIWRLFRLFLKIVYWGLFLFVDFNNIDVSAAIPNMISSTLDVSINLEKLFWFMIGSVIFDIVLTVLDFLIAFIPEKPKEDI